MKHITPNNDFVTKQDLEAFKDSLVLTLASKNDLLKLEERLDKKFTKRILDSQNALRTELQHDAGLFREEFMATLSVFSNRILTAIDPVMKELETRQQDRTLATAQIKHVEDDVENLKKRVTKLENA